MKKQSLNKPITSKEKESIVKPLNKKSLSIIGTGGTAVNNFVKFNKLSSLKQHASIFLWVRNLSLGYLGSLPGVGIMCNTEINNSYVNCENESWS